MSKNDELLNNTTGLSRALYLTIHFKRGNKHRHWQGGKLSPETASNPVKSTALETKGKMVSAMIQPF